MLSAALPIGSSAQFFFPTSDGHHHLAHRSMVIGQDSHLWESQFVHCCRWGQQHKAFSLGRSNGKGGGKDAIASFSLFINMFILYPNSFASKLNPNLLISKLNPRLNTFQNISPFHLLSNFYYTHFF
jgi:hypothetical protein